MKEHYLVAKTLRCDNGNFITDALVGFEIEGQLGIIALNDDLCGFFDRLDIILAGSSIELLSSWIRVPLYEPDP